MNTITTAKLLVAKGLQHVPMFTQTQVCNKWLLALSTKKHCAEKNANRSTCYK